VEGDRDGAKLLTEKLGQRVQLVGNASIETWVPNPPQRQVAGASQDAMLRT
jgi:hypothetical protein